MPSALPKRELELVKRSNVKLSWLLLLLVLVLLLVLLLLLLLVLLVTKSEKVAKVLRTLGHWDKEGSRMREIIYDHLKRGGCYKVLR